MSNVILDKYGGNENMKFEATGYFRTQKLKKGGWTLIDPLGNAFITIGVSHVDDINLKYEHNFKIWQERYGSKQDWIKKGAVKDLKSWGFNTIGWCQEWVSGHVVFPISWDTWMDNAHSVGWGNADYLVADMPFTPLFRTMDFEDWNGYPAYRDVNHRSFEMHCDHLARSMCLEFSENQNLLGYFLGDVPSWGPHPNGDEFKALKGLEKQRRETELYDIASKYYETMVSSIKRYDPNHMIFGDRYNGNKGIPEPVLKAMKPYVDIFSVQYFTDGNDQEYYDKMANELQEWSVYLDKPFMDADIGNSCKTELNPHRITNLPDQSARAQDYIGSLGTMMNMPNCVGWHWCSYVENTCRGWGMKDPYDNPYLDFVEPVAAFNKNIYSYVEKRM